MTDDIIAADELRYNSTHWTPTSLLASSLLKVMEVKMWSVSSEEGGTATFSFSSFRATNAWRDYSGLLKFLEMQFTPTHPVYLQFTRQLYLMSEF